MIQDRRFASITARRAEVLRLISEQRTIPEIAVSLQISEATARRHVEWLSEFLGVNSKRELGRWWSAHRVEWLRDLAVRGGVEVRW
ncbi:MAG: hypothetical protein HYX53_18170 [Chloroflexi bacterium]|nr:hypothetical protein [Chloroflexota bacterium]